MVLLLHTIFGRRRRISPPRNTEVDAIFSQLENFSRFKVCTSFISVDAENREEILV